jgi:type II secretory pathway component PulC
MIRKWFIMGVLALSCAFVLSEFLSQAVFYDPMEEVTGVEKTHVEKVKPEEAFRKAWTSAIRSRNLFSSSRSAEEPRPVVEKRPEPPAPPPPPPPPKPRFTLNGIILNQYDEYVAYLQKGNEQPMALREGDRIGDTQVVSITETSVELRWMNETITLTLSFD